MNSAGQNARDHNIELIDKVATVLEVLRHCHDGLTLGQIADRTGYVRSSVHRILSSLKKHSFVEQDYPGGAYRLGVQVLLLARGINTRTGVVQLARPYLQRLVAFCNETAYLAVMRGGKAVFVDVEETDRDLRLVGPMSAEVHFHATAAGKAIAAFLPADAQKALLSTGVADAALVAADIERRWEEVQRLGYALNDEETIRGAVFIAAPLFDSRGSVCGALSIGIPKSRYSPEVLQRIVPGLLEACRALSARIATVDGVLLRPPGKPVDRRVARIGDIS